MVKKNYLKPSQGMFPLSLYVNILSKCRLITVKRWPSCLESKIWQIVLGKFKLECWIFQHLKHGAAKTEL